MDWVRWWNSLITSSVQPFVPHLPPPPIDSAVLWCGTIDSVDQFRCILMGLIGSDVISVVVIMFRSIAVWNNGRERRCGVTSFTTPHIPSWTLSILIRSISNLIHSLTNVCGWCVLHQIIIGVKIDCNRMWCVMNFGVFMVPLEPSKFHCEIAIPMKYHWFIDWIWLFTVCIWILMHGCGSGIISVVIYGGCLMDLIDCPDSEFYLISPTVLIHR